MATNIPPHNLSEVIDGCVAYIDNPDIDSPGLMEYIKGPDFHRRHHTRGPHGHPCRLRHWPRQDHLAIPCHHRGDQERPHLIIITEIPYINKARLIENMVTWLATSLIEGITGLNDDQP